jgi:hypothetical protein
MSYGRGRHTSEVDIGSIRDSANTAIVSGRTEASKLTSVRSASHLARTRVTRITRVQTHVSTEARHVRAAQQVEYGITPVRSLISHNKPPSSRRSRVIESARLGHSTQFLKPVTPTMLEAFDHLIATLQDGYRLIPITGSLSCLRLLRKFIDVSLQVRQATPHHARHIS